MATYNAPVVEGAVLNMGYTGVVDTINILKDGLYKLEVWGGIGNIGSGGGYSVGYKLLKKNDIIYVAIGGNGGRTNDSGAYAYGGFNGGGAGQRGNGGGLGAATGGGGATHMALNVNRGVLEKYTNNRDEVLIIAGGSGGGASGSWDYESAAGGAGGGTNGGGGPFGRGATNSGGSAGHGGGGGWSGGAGGNWATPALGGTGYIAGVPTIIYRGTAYPSETKNGSSGGGRAAVTLIEKSIAPIFYNLGTIDAVMHGTGDITDIFYNTTQL